MRIAALALTLTLAFPALAGDLSGRVTAVPDGDTLAIGATRIRLCGIDAPERGTGGSREAADALRALVLGRHVECLPVGSGSRCDGRSSRMNRGRIVATCFVDGRDVAGELVRAGHACDWTRFSGGAYPGGCAR